MFEPGDLIYYGTGGLCVVEEVTKLDISGADRERLYYRLSPFERFGSTIYTPVDNHKVAMRKALTREEAELLIREMPQIEALAVKEERQKEQSYKEALNSADCRRWVGVIKSLYRSRKIRLSAGKKVTAVEERYFQMAKERLDSEIAHAMQIGREDVEEYITSRIGEA